MQVITVLLAFVGLSSGPKLFATELFDILVYPESVKIFLEANPKYTDGWMKSFDSRTDAYFKGRIRADWQNLQPQLPKSAHSALDIGSGVGGIDVLLASQFPQAKLTLVDKIDRVQNGVGVLRAAADLLLANGVSVERSRIIGADEILNQSSHKKFDLIISLRALGYIFPYEIYRDFLLEHLALGGTLILDVRTSPADKTVQEVIASIEKDFGGLGKVIRQGSDSIRIRVTRTQVGLCKM